MPSTSRRMASTGRRVRPTSAHTRAASNSVTAGTASSNDRVRVRALSSMSSSGAPTWMTTGLPAASVPRTEATWNGPSKVGSSSVRTTGPSPSGGASGA